MPIVLILILVLIPSNHSQSLVHGIPTPTSTSSPSSLVVDPLCLSFVYGPSQAGMSLALGWSRRHCPRCMGMCSVAMAQANVFAILGNKIVKNLKIFVEVDYLRSRGVLCQP